MAYKLMKRIIARGGYDKSATMDKLDVFFGGGPTQPGRIPGAGGHDEEGGRRRW